MRVNPRQLGVGFVFFVLNAVLFVLFFLLMLLRPFIVGACRLFVGLGVPAYIVLLIIRPDAIHPAFWWTTPVFLFVAFAFSYFYDTLLAWLTPDGRTMIFEQ